MKVLEIQQLTKRYGTFEAVKSVDLEVNEGEIYGLLGLNGAGKTTTIRMILDMIRPSEGSVTLFGAKLKSGDHLWNKIGYLVETPAAYPDLSVVENLSIYLKYRKLSNAGQLDSIMHQLELDGFRKMAFKNLSLGNKQRLGLAKALFHNPKLLILDEPTNGLDPKGIVDFRNMLNHLSQEGITIFVSSHLLDEVARVATRIGILHGGKLVREINSANLDSELKTSLIIKSKDSGQCGALLKTLGYQFAIDTQANVLASNMQVSREMREQIIRSLVEVNLAFDEIFIQKESLEDYFLAQIGKEGRNA
jgi:ABC-2 type transport system ATP-binding protein